jgi:hypothetical protein
MDTTDIKWLKRALVRSRAINKRLVSANVKLVKKNTRLEKEVKELRKRVLLEV